MTKRSIFLTIAAGLLASVAPATPSQAGPTTVTTDVSFTVLDTGLVTDVTVTYTPNVAPITNFDLVSSGGLTVTSETESGNTITIDFTGAKSASGLEWTFTTGTPPPINFSSFSFSGTSNYVASSVHVTTNDPAVPEPTSMALLGIGMTGFLAFRRLFKRTSVA